MLSSKIPPLVAAFIVLPMRLVVCLECYSCSAQLENYGSDYRNNCETFWYDSDYERNQIAHCLHADSVCAKFIVNHNGMPWVHRSCAPFDFCNELNVRYNNPTDLLLECETCSNDNLCNSSSSIVSTLIVIVLNLTFYVVT